MAKKSRKQSPRAPSLPLDEALERAIGVYEKEQRHPAPTDVVAQDLGYKSANNGAALSAIASLKGYGLLERPEAGKLAVSSDVQSYHYAPDAALKHQLKKKWLRYPPVFAELLDKYEAGLPSEATLRFDLIEAGFNPKSAESVLKAFKQSVDFVDYYAGSDERVPNEEYSPKIENEESAQDESVRPVINSQSSIPYSSREDLDRIPVRLAKNRRAWLEIPTPFYEADKKRLKAQIDLLLSDDDEEGNEPTFEE